MNAPLVPQVCPECGDAMRATGRGATFGKYGRRYVCRLAEAEEGTDARGHRVRRPGAKHAFTRVWSEDELAAQSGTVA